MLLSKSSPHLLILEANFELQLPIWIHNCSTCPPPTVDVQATSTQVLRVFLTVAVTSSPTLHRRGDTHWVALGDCIPWVKVQYLDLQHPVWSALRKWGSSPQCLQEKKNHCQEKLWHTVIFWLLHFHEIFQPFFPEAFRRKILTEKYDLERFLFNLIIIIVLI